MSRRIRLLDDSGIYVGRIHDEPNDMIAEIGISHVDQGAPALTLTNLSLAEAKKLRDWLSALIETAEAS